MTAEPRNPEAAAESEARLRQAVTEQPASVQALVRLAAWLRQQDRPNEALKVLEKSAAPACADLRLVRLHIHILLQLGRREDAVKIAATAVACTPESLDLRLLACRAHLENLQPALAQQQLDAAMQLDPGQQQLQRMKTMQLRINLMSWNSEHRPLDWLLRKFNRRRANVAREREKGD